MYDELKKNDVTIYTDGSCHTQLKIGAWASIILYDEQKLVLKGTLQGTTHQNMELQAVIESLLYLRQQKWNKQLIVIYTDSQYVIGIVQKKSRLITGNFLTREGIPIRNHDSVETLVHLLDESSVEFVKVKAHLKVPYKNLNLEVDKIARRAVRDSCRKLTERN